MELHETHNTLVTDGAQAQKAGAGSGAGAEGEDDEDSVAAASSHGAKKGSHASGGPVLGGLAAKLGGMGPAVGGSSKKGGKKGGTGDSGGGGGAGQQQLAPGSCRFPEQTEVGGSILGGGDCFLLALLSWPWSHLLMSSCARASTPDSCSNQSASTLCVSLAYPAQATAAMATTAQNPACAMSLCSRPSASFHSPSTPFSHSCPCQALVRVLTSEEYGGDSMGELATGRYASPFLQVRFRFPSSGSAAVHVHLHFIVIPANGPLLAVLLPHI